MSVVDTNIIDGIAVSRDGNKLILLVSDHLDWVREHEHLLQLQKKINSYLDFLEDKQFQSVYPDMEFNLYTIEIHFLHKPTANCLKFIDAVRNQLSALNISIDAIVVDA